MDQEKLRYVCEKLGVICDYFYQDNAMAAYGELTGILVDIEQAIGMIDDDDVQENIKNKLLEALQAMEQEDHILLADILNYEIKEILEKYVS